MDIVRVSKDYFANLWKEGNEFVIGDRVITVTRGLPPEAKLLDVKRDEDGETFTFYFETRELKNRYLNIHLKSTLKGHIDNEAS